MELDTVIKIIKQYLNQNKPIKLGKPQAGVLVPFLEKHNEAYVLLTKRSNSLKKHSGQISFPGGTMDATDPDIVYTALRETREELGIPPQSVNIIGIFHDFRTPYYQAVTPVIGVVPSDFPYQPSADEIEEVLEVPISDLIHLKTHHTEEWEYEGNYYHVHFFDWYHNNRKYVIWGATGGVLYKLLKILRGENFE